MLDCYWKCKRCQRIGTDGCDMPDYRVPVPWDDGTTTMERPACPLELILLPRRRSRWQRFKDLIRP